MRRGNFILKIYNYFRSVVKNYIFFALYLLSRPSLITLPFKGIHLPQYIQYEWMRRFQINTFIDIGAHDGNISRVIHYMFPQVTIFAFEPLKQKRDLIKSKIGSNNLVVETLALSDHVGSKNFYEYDYLAASSFLKPNLKRKTFTKKIAKSYPIRVTTLDKYFDKKKLIKPIFIKMDTQGTENLIIKGGRNILKQATLLIIETSFIKTYIDQCLFENIYNSLIKLGFIYKGSMLDSHFYPVFGPLVQENAIFIKKGELSNYLLTEDV